MTVTWVIAADATTLVRGTTSHAMPNTLPTAIRRHEHTVTLRKRSAAWEWRTLRRKALERENEYPVRLFKRREDFVERTRVSGAAALPGEPFRRRMFRSDFETVALPPIVLDSIDATPLDCGDAVATSAAERSPAMPRKSLAERFLRIEQALRVTAADCHGERKPILRQPDTQYRALPGDGRGAYRLVARPGRGQPRNIAIEQSVS